MKSVNLYLLASTKGVLTNVPFLSASNTTNHAVCSDKTTASSTLHSTTAPNLADKCFASSLEPPTTIFSYLKAGGVHIEPDISDFEGPSSTHETKTLPNEPFAEHE